MSGSSTHAPGRMSILSLKCEGTLCFHSSLDSVLSTFSVLLNNGISDLVVAMPEEMHINQSIDS